MSWRRFVLILAWIGCLGSMVEGPCADECAAAAIADDHGGDDDGDRGDASGGDCPALCGGCLRQTADARPRGAVLPQPLVAATAAAAMAPLVFLPTPPAHRLFRPPRA